MQDSAAIKIHHLDLSQYGTNPQGKPVYRIVWADSRVEKFEYEGKVCEVPIYAGKADGKWVLEKWVPSSRFYGTPKQFEDAQRMTGVRMEYAHDGTYQHCDGGVFPGEVTPKLAHLWASGMLFDQENHTNAERALALREAYAESKRIADEKKTAIIQKVVERSNG